jgi:hypothetical protein
MRFSAAIQSQQPLQTPTAADLIRRLVTGEALSRPPPMPEGSDELPIDLDQRVRLVGEW